MGDKITLKVDARDLHGKKVAILRAQGLTPGVVYGPGIEPVDVQVDSVELRKIVTQAGKHSPVHLTGAKKRIAMIKDVDFDPVRRGVIRHVSFHAVNANEPVNAEVPIRLVGEGESVADDGRADEDDDEDDKQTIMDLVIANVYEPSALQASNEAAAGDATDESEVAAENGAEETQSSDESVEA